MTIVNYDTTTDYQRFNLKECEMQLSQYCNERDIDAIAYGNYFISSQNLSVKAELFIIDHEKCYRVNKANCKFASCDLLEKHKLVMGSYTGNIETIYTSVDYLRYLIEFKNIIIDAKLFWVGEFLKIVHEYLKSRRSNLINKEIIQVMLGDIIVHVKSAERYRHFAKNFSIESIEAYQAGSLKELRSATHLLAKLHGGRSFLSGNMVEMIMMFEYFRDIYFS